MNYVQAVALVNELVQTLVAHGVLNADGSVGNPDVKADLATIAAVEVVLRKYGVALPARVDEVISAVATLLPFFVR